MNAEEVLKRLQDITGERIVPYQMEMELTHRELEAD